MPEKALKLVPREAAVATYVDLNAVLNALDLAVLVLDARGCIQQVNVAAEQLLGRSADAMGNKPLHSLSPALHTVETIAKTALERDTVVSEHSVELSLINRKNRRIVVDVAAAPIADCPGHVVVRMIETTLSQSIDRRLGYLGAGRSVSGMASVLAHEVKNPLSGIRGASQLLDQHVSEADRALTDLIRDEVDRICGLVDRMGQFSDSVHLHSVGLNIHKVLDRVHKLAESGFASRVRFSTDYDPSLPPVSGDRDLLVQVFLNLIKNASEAAPLEGACITLKTSYLPGIRLASDTPQTAKVLPICVEIIDNGDGVPAGLRDHLFDPFVTSKPSGSGLGLALTAKIISDHGGLIDFDTSSRGTTLRVLLPVHPTTGTTP